VIFIHLFSGVTYRPNKWKYSIGTFWKNSWRPMSSRFF
jgi:hypothetical protein